MSGRSRTRFAVLVRMFFQQFFTSPSVTSDAQLHQTYVWVLVFLLVPGAFLLLTLFPEFQAVVILAHLGRAPLSQIDDYLAWIAFFLTTYSMVAVGFVTVLAWDALTFDRRDALVLGSLPIPPRVLLSAKLVALSMLLMLVGLSVSSLNAVMFALVTSDQLGAVVFVQHLLSMFVAAAGSSVFIFAAIVMLRGLVTLMGGPALADAFGPPLQFVCVVMVLCLMLLSPAVWQVPFMTASRTGWMPSAWFVGVFEQLRGSARAADPSFPFRIYTQRAVAGSLVVLVGSVLLSAVEFRRQVSAALAPRRAWLVLSGAFVSRAIARLLSGWDIQVRAISEFTLLTLTRNRRHQLPIALNAAVGATFVIVALATSTTVGQLMRPRTAILWIPLVMGYWMTAGLRAAFFTTSELAASWTFRSQPTVSPASRWRAVRSAMAGFVLPRVLLICIALAPALGWSLTLMHAGLVLMQTLFLTGVMAIGVRHVPFTRPYEPGHARLRTRWILYAAGLYFFAYWPARLELSWQREPAAQATMVLVMAAAAATLEVLMRYLPEGSAEMVDLEEDSTAGISVLDLGGARHGAIRA